MQSNATSKRPSRPLSFRVTGVPKWSFKRASAIGVAFLFVAFGALAQQAEPVPPVIVSLDGVPTNPSASVHDFTGLPLTSDGWTDLHGMIMSAGYSDARIVYVSATGNDSSAQVYNQSSAVLGGQPLNPTGAIAPFRTLGAAYNQLRNGYPDVMLLRRGDSWGSSSVNVDKAGRSNSQRLIVAAYGPEAVARPIARVVPETAASHVVLSSLQTNFLEPLTGSSENYRGNNILVEDVAWRGPVETHSQIWGSMLDWGGGTMRRNSANWCVFFNGWEGGPQLPSRFEENTISRASDPNNAVGVSNVYFSESAYNIQSIRNVSLFTPRVGFRQRRGGVVRENLTMGRDPEGQTWGNGFDVGANTTFVNNVAMHIVGPTVFQALQSAYVAGNIYTAFYTNPQYPTMLFGDYIGRLGGWTGDTVFDGNIYYSPGTTYTYGDAFPAVDLPEPATATFRNEYMVRTNSSQVLAVLDHPRITYEDNHYFSTAAEGSWFSGQTYAQMMTTGTVFDPATWPDPGRDLVSYMQSIGANPSGVDQALEWFSDGVPGNPSLAGALANRRGAWDDRFTSIAVINYIREGFGLSRL